MSKAIRQVERRSNPGPHVAFARVPRSQILIYFKEGNPTPLFPPDDSAQQGSWTGLLVEEHHLPPITCPDGFPRRHLVAIHYRPAALDKFLSSLSPIRGMKHGSLDIVPRGTPLGGYGYDDTEFIILALEPTFVEQIASESGKSDSELIRHLRIRDPQIEFIAFALKSELETGCPSGRVYGDGLAVALAARLLGKYSSRIPVPHSRTIPLLTSTLRRVTSYINENLTQDLTLADIAQVAHMSPHYFSRAFRESTGMPPHKYVMDRRIEKAKILLLDKNLPLVEVGLSVGFQNQSHFTTLFHKRTGVTPKTYRSGT